MGFPFHQDRLPGRLLATALMITATATSRGDYSISNNLTGAAGGVESATGTTYITAGFGSGTT